MKQKPPNTFQPIVPKDGDIVFYHDHIDGTNHTGIVFTNRHGVRFIRALEGWQPFLDDKNIEIKLKINTTYTSRYDSLREWYAKNQRKQS